MSKKPPASPSDAADMVRVALQRQGIPSVSLPHNSFGQQPGALVTVSDSDHMESAMGVARSLPGGPTVTSTAHSQFKVVW